MGRRNKPRILFGRSECIDGVMHEFILGPDLCNACAVLEFVGDSHDREVWTLVFGRILRLGFESVGGADWALAQPGLDAHAIDEWSDSDECRYWTRRLRELSERHERPVGPARHIVIDSVGFLGLHDEFGKRGIEIICRDVVVRRGRDVRLSAESIA